MATAQIPLAFQLKQNWAVCEKGYGCKWKWETIQLFTYKQINVNKRAFIAVIHFTVTVGSSIMITMHTQR
jgi:hypothetical protein